MRGAQPSLIQLDRFERPLVHVPPSTKIASAFSSGSSTTSHAPRRDSAKMREEENRRQDEGAADEEAFQLFDLERADEHPAPRAGAGQRKLNQIQIQTLPFNQSHVSSPRTLLGFLDGEVDALAFPKQLEHRAPHGAAMKEMLQAGFITDESEALVD